MPAPSRPASSKTNRHRVSHASKITSATSCATLTSALSTVHLKHHQQHRHHLPSSISAQKVPLETPTRRTQQQPEVLPSPSTEGTSSSAASPSSEAGEVPGLLFPPVGYQRAVQQMAHQSALFNSRAVAALDHPDLKSPFAGRVRAAKAETRAAEGLETIEEMEKGSVMLLPRLGRHSVCSVCSLRCCCLLSWRRVSLDPIPSHR